MTASVIEASEEFAPATVAELERFLGENARKVKKPVYPVGGRTALHYGYPLCDPGTVVSTARLSRVVDYPARDMTVTVEAGIRMEQLNELLDRERQRLPIDIPQLHRATLGGVLATNSNGPRRYGYGTLRDYVIGVSAIDGRGNLFHAGGRVVKNVAGYDLCKLMIGSLGTLAVITQVTLKLRPVPETSSWLWCSYPTWQQLDEALERLTTTATRPVAMIALNARAARQIVNEIHLDVPVESPTLALAIEGTQKETEWQSSVLKDELSFTGASAMYDIPGHHGESVWTALTDYPVVTDEPLTFRANMLPSRAAGFMERADATGISLLSHIGNGIVIGHFPDDWISWEQSLAILNSLSHQAQENRGNFVILQCPDEWKRDLLLWGQPESGYQLMKKMKAAFDPEGVLNPHRLFVKA
ncbi:MAG: FAD-binding oxidoreductase [Planctomycetota bacterium]|nr:FAD-binding oxidoreductase [Planctomycetota bacterium]MDA1214950.1 FAD-binding oxidoreductase [Planctomycetota bacterium]